MRKKLWQWFIVVALQHQIEVTRIPKTQKDNSKKWLLHVEMKFHQGKKKRGHKQKFSVTKGQLESPVC